MGHVARIGQMRNGYESLIGKPEGKRSLGGPGSSFEDNIKMDLEEGVEMGHSVSKCR
jgi:hypothetical protein